MGEIEVIESDTGQEKINYSTVLFAQLLKINDILSRINETNPELFKIAANLDDDDLKPNRINFVNSVDALEITFDPYIDVKFKEKRDEVLRDESLNDVDKAKARFRIIVNAMKKKGLLPLELLG